jgi:hypothetical protein
MPTLSDALRRHLSGGLGRLRFLCLSRGRCCCPRLDDTFIYNDRSAPVVASYANAATALRRIAGTIFSLDASGEEAPGLSNLRSLFKASGDALEAVPGLLEQPLHNTRDVVAIRDVITESGEAVRLAALFHF